jgi:hypothetical protein
LKRISLTTFLFCLALLLPAGAFAKDKSTEVHIYQATQVGEVTLQPGTYQIKVMPTGNSNDVSFLRNGKQVAKVSGCPNVQLAKKANNTSVTLDNSGKVPRVAEIDFEGQQTAVGFNAAPVSASAGE